MSFKDIKGQAQAIEMIQSDIRNSTLAGSYLFTGQEGVGKFLTALNLAKAVNCAESETDPCGRCSPCARIEKRQHPDVYFIEPEGTGVIRIENIRELKKQLGFRSYEAKKKVFIINDAHRLNPAAASALLKSLEEPGTGSLIILITAKPNLLFKTIISRCRIVRFHPLDREALSGILRSDFKLDKLEAHYLAYFSEGRIGCALRMREAEGILRNKNRLIDAFALPGGRDPVESGVIEKREEIRVLLNLLSSWFRDIYLLKSGFSSSELINLDRQDDLLRSIDQYSWEELDEAMNTISQSIAYLEGNLNTKLLLSNLKVQICRG